MKHNFIFVLLIAIISCGNETTINKKSSPPGNLINSDGTKVSDRIKPPDGYKRNAQKENSFEYFLQNLPIKPVGSKILDYKGNPISNQSEHVAVIDLEIGNKDLQQCADAIIRLRSDYLFSQKRFDEIKFHFTSGDLYAWTDHSNGIRPKVIGNKVSFSKTMAEDLSEENYRKYLDIVFNYAGTISITKEMKKLKAQNEITIGTVISNPGSPGHALIVIEEAENAKGEKIFLLAQGYTPAQSIHILTNPFDASINPWYKLDISGNIMTARYGFENANLLNFNNE